MPQSPENIKQSDVDLQAVNSREEEHLKHISVSIASSNVWEINKTEKYLPDEEGTAAEENNKTSGGLPWLRRRKKSTSGRESFIGVAVLGNSQQIHAAVAGITTEVSRTVAEMKKKEIENGASGGRSSQQQIVVEGDDQVAGGGTLLLVGDGGRRPNELDGNRMRR